MGWNGGNEIFDPVARKLIELDASPEVITEMLAVLIGNMQQGDWDTEDESLAEFADNEAVVEAFRRNGVIVQCGEQGHTAGRERYCERETGPRGHADNQHEDWRHVTWPVAKPEE
jgi:hypothetical protein